MGKQSVKLSIDGKVAVTLDKRSAHSYAKDLEAQVDKYTEFFKSIYNEEVDPMKLLEHDDPMIVDYAFSVLS